MLAVKEVQKTSISLGACELSWALNKIRVDARIAADEGAASFSQGELPQAHSQKIMVKAYERLSIDTDYIRETREPLLLRDVKVKLHLDYAAAENFQCAAKDEPYSLAALAHFHGWYETLSAGIDPHIPADTLRGQIKKYTDRINLSGVLNNQFHDASRKNAALEILGHSKTGSEMQKMARSYGYNIHFVDVRLHDLIDRDNKSETTLQSHAVCFEEGLIFVNAGISDPAGKVISKEAMAIGDAISIVHEMGHIFQNKELKHLKESGECKGLMEAHSIAGEYVVGAELLSEGLPAKPVYDSLYGLAPDTINLLRTDPEQFLREIGGGDLVRKRWHFAKEEMVVPLCTLESLPTLRPG